MKVLIACEYSGKVRSAFEKLGHFAVSCDLLPTEKPGFHYQCDVFDIINEGWDLMVAHPPCTDLAVSGAAWFKEKIADGRQQRALDFVQALMNAPIPMIAIENPISVISSKIRKPDQIIQPWMFGHRETKATCLWLKGLPKLVPTTDLKEETMALPRNERMRLHYLPPSADRWKIRSETFQGIADAMANQWGKV
jgi:site-specific DNA-cytosine methylase